MRKTQIELEDIATTLAINVKATGFDMGDHYETDWNLTDDEWNAVCDLAEKLYPDVEPSDELRAEWAQARRDVDAEIRHEQRQLGYY